MKKKEKRQALSTEEQVVKTREKTAQQWMPISDIKGNLVYRKDKMLVAALKVQPKNLELLSDNEKRKCVDSLTEVLNGEKEGLQIFCIGRPVDLNDYLEWLQEKAKREQDFNKKMLLKGFMQQASALASSGTIIERRFYIIITKQLTLKAEDEINNRLKELRNGLLKAELSVDFCEEDDYMDLFSMFANPIQAAYEKAEFNYELSTMLN